MLKIMRVLGFAALATTLHMGSAFAFAPDSCNTDPQNANRCDPFDAGQRCHRSSDGPGQATGVCAASFGCTCVDPDGGIGGACAVAAPGGEGGTPFSTAIPLGFLGASVLFRRFKRKYATTN